MTQKYFVTGIDTNIGKTVVSAILAEAMKADYWKPIQSGDLENSDTKKVRSLVSSDVTFFEETYRLSKPLSPHISAKSDGIEIDLNNFILPQTSNNLIVEGAGGLLVPINYKGAYIADLIQQLNLEVILVVKNYLGSINHTLLSIHYLQNKNIPIKGIIINGKANAASEEIIEKNTGVKILFYVPETDCLDKQFILEQAEKLKKLNLL